MAWRMSFISMACVLLFTLSVSDAQVARQGERPPDQPETRRFRSPMIVELPLVVVAPHYWGAQPVRTGEAGKLKYFVCDGVAVLDLAMSAVRKRSGVLKIGIDFTLSTEEGTDKEVTVQIAAVADERVVQTVTVLNIDAEEGRIASRSARLLIPKQDVSALSERPVLRLTLYVRDNE